MGRGKRMMRQQAMTQRQQRKYRRLGLLIAAPVVVVGLVAVIVLTRQPGYSGFDVIGKRPAVVQVFLPG